MASTSSDGSTGASALHDPQAGDSNLQNLASAYTLLNPVSSNESGNSVYTDGSPSGQAYSRHFGRVSTNSVTYGAGAGAASPNSVTEVTHKLNSNDVMCLGLVVSTGYGSGLPAAGNMIFPESRSGTTVNSRKVKVQGTVSGDVVKFIFVG